jgi:hypothetical protein
MRRNEAHPSREHLHGFGVRIRARFDLGDLFHHVYELPLFVGREVLVKEAGEQSGSLLETVRAPGDEAGLAHALGQIVIEAEDRVCHLLDRRDLLTRWIPAYPRHEQHQDHGGVARVVDGGQGRGTFRGAGFRQASRVFAPGRRSRICSRPPMRTNQKMNQNASVLTTRAIIGMTLGLVPWGEFDLPGVGNKTIALQRALPSAANASTQTAEWIRLSFNFR